MLFIQSEGVTPTVAIVYESRLAEERTPFGPPPDSDENIGRQTDSTDFVALRRTAPILTLNRDETRATASSDARAVTNQAAPQGHHAAASARDKRLALLARRHAGLESLEDRARLQILTAQLRRLAPRVEPSDFDAIEDTLKTIETTDERVEAIRRKFQIR